MADKIPVKAILTEGNTSALGEFNPGDTLGVAFGGTGADNAASARTSLGLGNVDNTSDIDKPVSTAQAAADTVILNAAALDATTKANAAEADAIAASTPIAHLSDLNNPHSVTKTQIGLGNVDNTSDLNKPISTATQTALNAKEASITAGTTSQFWRGDKTWTDFATTVRATVLTGLSLATGTVIAATDSILVALGKLQKQITDNLSTLTTHTGNASNPHSVTKTQVGLGSVDNTADVDKPISTATQTALNLKANLVSPSFTTPVLGVATGTSFNSITGLSSTTPVMDGVAAVGTGTTTARADHVHPTDTTRAPINSPSFTGTVSAPSNFNATGAALKLQTGGTDRITIDAATGAIGIGVVPSAWGASWNSLEVAKIGASIASNALGYINLIGNGYNDGTNWRYANGFGASQITLARDTIVFYTNQSGTAGSVYSPKERARIDAGGVLVTDVIGLGYGYGAGGTVTQATSKSTAVTLNKPCGRITVNGASLGAGSSVEFLLNNSLLAMNDILVMSMSGPLTLSANYKIGSYVIAGSAVISIRNVSATTLSEAFSINFAIIKGANS